MASVSSHHVEKVTISKKHEREINGELFYTRDIIVYAEDERVYITLFSDHKENLNFVNVG